MADANGQPQRPEEPLPTNFAGMNPDELIARAMNSVKMTSGSAGAWSPPGVEAMAGFFPQYEILSLLGHGGMGAVYKARQFTLDRFVAIKLLPLEISVDQNYADRFQREARAMGRLSHPNIVAVFDFGHTAEGHLYIVMEFVDGATLHDWIHTGSLKAHGALHVIEQACEALAYAHAHGIIHRDVKPANMLVDRELRVKLVDFGLARVEDTSVTQWGSTMTGQVMGTPDYMAPEQSRNMKVDHRADIYSLGVVLYEAFAKETPKGVFEPLSQRAGADPRIDAIVTRAMQQQPDRRYGSTGEMKAAVEAVRTTLDAARTAPPHGESPPAAEKSRTGIIIGAAAAVALLIGVGVFALSGGKEKRRAQKPGDPTPVAAVARTEPATPAPTAAATPVPKPVAAATPALEKPPAPPDEPKVAMIPAPPAIAADALTFTGWKGPGNAAAADSWQIEAGVVSTSKQTVLWSPVDYGDFELEIEWKVGPRGNGGVYYHVPGADEHEALEMQLCDKANAGGIWSGGLFGVIPSRGDHAKPVGEWNTAKLVVKGTKGEHWINGTLACEYDTASGEFANLLVTKKVKDKPGINARTGRIVLQANAGEVAYRNLRIRTPDAPGTPAVTPPPAPPAAPMPTETVAFAGSRYRFIPLTGTWSAAKSAAENLGGHLVSITSKEENDWIRATFIAPLSGDEMLWIGATNINAESKWKWVNGEPVEFMDWSRAARIGGNGQGSAFTRDEGWITWNNKATPRSKGFIVEWEDKPVVVKPALPPASPEVVKWLGEQEAIFTAQWNKDAVAPFDAAVAKLREQYAAAIEKNIADATKAAKLEDALAWRSEKARIAAQQPHDVEDTAGEPAALKQLRAAWRKNFAKLDTERFAKAKAVHQRFDALLAAGVIGYTQRQRLDDALLLKTKRDEIAKTWLTPPLDFSKAAPPKPPLGERFAPPKPVSAGTGTLTGREAVAHLRGLGFYIGFTDADGVLRQITHNNNVEDIPGGRIEITGLSTPGNRRIDSGTEPITDEDFAKIAPMKKLRSFEVKTGNVTGTGFAFLAGSPDLETVTLDGADFTDAAIEPLVALRNIRSLVVVSNRRITLARFGEFASLPALETLAFGVIPPGQASPFTGIAKARKLKDLTLTECPLSFDRAEAIAALPDLTKLTLSGTQGPALAKLEKLQKLTALTLTNAPESGAHLAFIGKLRKLETLSLDGAEAPGLAAAGGAPALRTITLGAERGGDDTALKAIAAAFPRLETLAFGPFETNRRYTPTGIRELAKMPKLTKVDWAKTTLPDEMAAALAELPTLESLILSASGITETQLAELAKSKSLTKLNLFANKLSPATLEQLKTMKNLRELSVYGTGIKLLDLVALRKALPRCKVSE